MTNIIETEMKECKMCGTVKPLTEYYQQKQTRKDGTIVIYYHPECKPCTVKKSTKWRNNHPDRVAASEKKYKQSEKFKIRHKVHAKKSREKGVYKEWQRNNPDKIKVYNQTRKMNKNHEISKKEWDSCKEYFNNECAYCGVSEQEAKEQQGQYLHKEHVRNDGANDLSNCIPSCRNCNVNKWTYNFDEWYNDGNTNYTYERFEKINKWLNDDYKKYIEVKFDN